MKVTPTAMWGLTSSVYHVWYWETATNGHIEMGWFTLSTLSTYSTFTSADLTWLGFGEGISTVGRAGREGRVRGGGAASWQPLESKSQMLLNALKALFTVRNVFKLGRRKAQVFIVRLTIFSWG